MNGKNRAFVFSGIAFILIIPAIIIAASYMNMLSIGSEATFTHIKSDKLYHFFTTIEKDLTRAAEISGRRAVVAALDYIISNNTPLDTYSTAYGNGAEGALRELVVEGKLNGENISLMENQTVSYWISSIIDKAREFEYNINITDTSIEIKPYSSFYFTVEVQLYGRITDIEGRFVYEGEIPRDRKISTKVSIIGLEDPLFPLRTNGKAHRIIQPSPYSRLVIDTGVKGYIISSPGGDYSSEAETPRQGICVGTGLSGGWSCEDPKQVTITLDDPLPCSPVSARLEFSARNLKENVSDRNVTINDHYIGTVPSQDDNGWVDITMEFDPGYLVGGDNTVKFYSGSDEWYVVRNIYIYYSCGGPSGYKLNTFYSGPVRKADPEDEAQLGEVEQGDIMVLKEPSTTYYNYLTTNFTQAVERADGIVADGRFDSAFASWTRTLSSYPYAGIENCSVFKSSYDTLTDGRIVLIDNFDETFGYVYDIDNLYHDIEYGYYHESEYGASFFDRMENRTNVSEKYSRQSSHLIGLESFIAPSDLVPFTADPYVENLLRTRIDWDQSCIDYLFFDDEQHLGYRVKGITLQKSYYPYFRIDLENAEKYGIISDAYDLTW